MSEVHRPGAPERGPFRVEQLRSGDRYELSDGHPIYCPPASPEHGESRAFGSLVVGTDPAVHGSGMDIGHKLDEQTLRAPDLSVGDLGDDGGTWAVKAPALAVEYVTPGEDEADLQTKIRQLLEAGTRFVWVVRLHDAKRVEVYEKGRAAQTKLPGERLEAPGILQSRPLVEALYDPEAANEQTLQNLLERKGYAGLEAVVAEGEARGREAGLREGKEEGLRVAVLDLCEVLGIEPTGEQRAQLGAMGVGELEALRLAIKQTKRWPV